MPISLEARGEGLAHAVRIQKEASQVRSPLGQGRQLAKGEGSVFAGTLLLPKAFLRHPGLVLLEGFPRGPQGMGHRGQVAKQGLHLKR